MQTARIPHTQSGLQTQTANKKSTLSNQAKITTEANK